MQSWPRNICKNQMQKTKTWMQSCNKNMEGVVQYRKAERAMRGQRTDDVWRGGVQTIKRMPMLVLRVHPWVGWIFQLSFSFCFSHLPLQSLSSGLGWYERHCFLMKAVAVRLTVYTLARRNILMAKLISMCYHVLQPNSWRRINKWAEFYPGYRIQATSPSSF